MDFSDAFTQFEPASTTGTNGLGHFPDSIAF